MSVAPPGCFSRETAAPAPPFRLRRLAKYLPVAWQRRLRQAYYGWQIGTGRFVSDEPEFMLLDQWVRPGDWVLDIGANVGHYTLRLSQLVGPQGRVFAFEPIPETFSVLAANSRRAAYQNITLLNVAVSNKSKVAAMVIPQGRTGLDGHYFAHMSNGAAGNTDKTGTVETQVFCCSIDSLQFPRPISLVKIDVEGHELQVLEGMQQLLGRDRPTVIVEATSPAAVRVLQRSKLEQLEVKYSRNYVFRKQFDANTEQLTTPRG